MTSDYTYYANNRLHTLANKRGNVLLSTFNYAYDGNGNMLTKLEIAGQTTYQYDALGRLTRATEPGGKVTQYSFNAAGNRSTQTITQSGASTTTTYSYNIQGHLLYSRAERFANLLRRIFAAL
jgi:YD repeat-containing protein